MWYGTIETHSVVWFNLERGIWMKYREYPIMGLNHPIYIIRKNMTRYTTDTQLQTKSFHVAISLISIEFHVK